MADQDKDKPEEGQELLQGPAPKLESDAVREMRNSGAAVMKSLLEKTTNRSSGSLDESQERSLEIDMGGGHILSRKSPTAGPADRAGPVEIGPFAQLSAPSEIAQVSLTKLPAERQTLKELAQAKIENPKELSQFMLDMENFERDFTARSVKAPADKEQEIANTYAQMGRLLSADSDVLARYPECKLPPDKAPWRVQVAEQIIHQAAEPTSIDQGVLAVCETSSLQVRLYYRDPASIARLVTDVLLDGKYTASTRDKSIDMTGSPVNLIPDEMASQFTIEGQQHGVSIKRGDNNYKNIRSYAAQLFDATAINMVLSGRGYRYEQPTAKEVIDISENAQGWVVSLDGKHRYLWRTALDNKLSVRDEEVVKLNHWVLGRREVGFLIKSPILTEAEAANPNVRKFYDFSNRDSGLATLYSPSELPKLLASVEDEGQWPPIAALNTKATPFNKTGGGGHNLVITAKSTDGHLISFDNTWGKQFDRNGPPSVDAVTFGKAIWATHEPGESCAGGLKSLIEFSKSNKTAWENLKRGWLELPEKIARGNRQQVMSAYLQTHQDAILNQWQKEHPEDKNLELWKESLLQWLSKYPEEHPTVSK
jgi:hypothetical protein